MSDIHPDIPVCRVVVADGEEIDRFLHSVEPCLAACGATYAVSTLGLAVDRSRLKGGVIALALEDESQLGCLYEISRYADLVFHFVHADKQLDHQLNSAVVAAELLSQPPGSTMDQIKGLVGSAAEVPVWACLLIGGKSSRMGRPKHLLPDLTGQTWLERSVDILSRQVDGMVISGQGEIPENLGHLVRLEDVEGGMGPLAGVLSAFRWLPDVSWVVLACDMPLVSEEALRWLLSGRRPGRWGKIPRLAGNSRVEPLFARYDRQCGPVFERMHRQGDFRISGIGKWQGIEIAQPPPAVQRAWQNINTPEEFRDYGGK